MSLVCLWSLSLSFPLLFLVSSGFPSISLTSQQLERCLRTGRQARIPFLPGGYLLSQASLSPGKRKGLWWQETALTLPFPSSHPPQPAMELPGKRGVQGGLTSLRDCWPPEAPHLMEAILKLSFYGKGLQRTWHIFKYLFFWQSRNCFISRQYHCWHHRQASVRV